MLNFLYIFFCWFPRIFPSRQTTNYSFQMLISVTYVNFKCVISILGKARNAQFLKMGMW